MKKLIIINFCIFILLCFAGCESGYDPFPFEEEKYMIYNLSVNYSKIDKDIMEDYLRPKHEKLFINTPDILEKLKNITPVSLESKCQIYKFPYDNCGGLDGQAFLIYNDKVFELGIGFGGHGVTEFAYYKDSVKERLYYIYSWGSGIHRSQLAFFDFKNETIENSLLNIVNEQIYSMVDGDVAFYLSSDKKTLGLCTASINSFDYGIGASITRLKVITYDVHYYFPWLEKTK